MRRLDGRRARPQRLGNRFWEAISERSHIRRLHVGRWDEAFSQVERGPRECSRTTRESVDGIAGPLSRLPPSRRARGRAAGTPAIHRRDRACRSVGAALSARGGGSPTRGGRSRSALARAPILAARRHGAIRENRSRDRVVRGREAALALSDPRDRWHRSSPRWSAHARSQLSPSERIRALPAHLADRAGDPTTRGAGFGDAGPIREIATPFYAGRLVARASRVAAPQAQRDGRADSREAREIFERLGAPMARTGSSASAAPAEVPA